MLKIAGYLSVALNSILDISSSIAPLGGTSRLTLANALSNRV